LAQSVIGALRVNLGLDSAQFSRGMTDAQKSLAVAQKQFLAVAAVAVAAFAGISAAALAGARAIDANAKAARRVGASVAGFRALELAAGEAGVSLSSLANDVQTMNRELARAEIGEGNAAEALERMGMAASDFAGLDADERVAVLADAVQRLGLDSGETTLLLRDLGIRNREMALLVMGGGDAIRNARNDVQSYGLALSDVDAKAIEGANDQIGRLGLITNYIGDQLAKKFVPAMGAMAEAITDAMREGGTLRKVLDGLVGNLDRIAVYIGVVVSGFGLRYVAALVAARVATASLSGALVLLRGALIRTGIGAIVVGVGELVLWIDKARKATGSFGAGFKMIGLQVKAASLNMKAWFLGAINSMIGAFIDMTWAIADGLNNLFGSNLSGMDAFITQDIARAMRAAEDGAAAATAAANALRTNMTDVIDVTTEVGASIETINDALETTGGAGADSIDALNDGLSVTLPVVDRVADAFADFVMRGFRDFKSFARSILDTFKDMLRQMIATSIANPIKLAMGFGSSVAGSAASAGQGMMGSMGSSVMGAGIGSNLLAAGSAMTGIGTAAFTGSFGAGMGATVAGGLSGMSGAVGAGMAAGGSAGAAMALGAIALPVAAVIATVMFFKKSTKELDNGLKVAIEGMDATAETFRKIQTSRFFGLSKSTSTRSTADPDNPIIGAVNAVQNSIVQAARVLGVGASAFDDFSAEFKVSLKGLTEDQKLAKINEELANMGDEFASLVPGFENMNQVLERAAQISAQVRALTDTQGLFATRQEAVFAASQAGNLTGEVDVTQGLLRDLIKAVREGDVNNGRLTAQLVAIQQRQELAPT
jgi:hypothetical protein